MLSNTEKLTRALNAIRESVSTIEKLVAAEQSKDKKKGKITLAEKVKQLKEIGKTQDEIAAELGLNQSAVSSILNGFKFWDK